LKVHEKHYVVDLLVRDNTCYGVLAFDRASAEPARSSGPGGIVLATGGLGGLYEHNTNPEIATGDGIAIAIAIAIAFRAGAEVMDMEFVQFHPTG